MRKVVLDLAVTLDGFIEGPNGEVDWCIMEDDMDFDDFLSSIDTIFYGRVSYDLWGNFQSEEPDSPTEHIMWKKIHSKDKVVFSSRKRLDDRATFINNDIKNKVVDIKNKTGKDIWLYGGAKLIETFTDLGLIDRYRISIHPIILGNGTPLFKNKSDLKKLRLIQTNTFKSGVVQLIYDTR